MKIKGKKINERVFHTFIKTSTECVLKELEKYRSLYLDDYWNNLVPNSKGLNDFFNSYARLQDEISFFDLLSNALESCPEDQTQIFNGFVSADAYTRVSTLSILKFGNLFYCLYQGDELERCVTTDPLNFFLETYEGEESVHEEEINNLKANEDEGYFENFVVNLDVIEGLFY